MHGRHAPFFLLVLLAGCFSPGTPSSGSTEPMAVPSDPNGPAFQATLVPIPEGAPTSAQAGYIQGDVMNPFNESVPGAFVILIGTNHSMRADERGRFGFANVAAGAYRLLVNARTFEALEADLDVVEGHVTRVVARLNYTEAVAGFHDHVHDRFGGKPTKVLYDEIVAWDRGLTDQDTRQDCIMAGGTHIRPTVYPNTPTSEAQGPCRTYELPLHEPIPPGTRAIRFAASWKTQDYVRKVEFFYRPTNVSQCPQAYSNWCRTEVINGGTIDVTINRTANDNGHAPTTAWRVLMNFDVAFAAGTGWNEGDFIRDNVAPFHVRMEALKGQLWSEGPHPHFWAQGPHVVVLDNATKVLKGFQYDRTPLTNGGADNPYFNADTHLVPPGTTRLDVTFSYTPASPALDGLTSRKTIAFRTAAVDKWKATLPDLRVEEPAAFSTHQTTYRLRIDANETDSFYASVSGWAFLFSNEGKERDPKFTNECTNGCGGTEYKLTAVAINENWTEEFALGAI